MEDSVGKDLEAKPSVAAAGDDDVLSQSDNLLIDVSFSTNLTEDRSSGPGNETSCEQLEQMPKLLGTPEPEKTGKNGKFNLRKSLAWDSAFFTSDGVLDAEELSTMIEGGEKGVKHQLPGIEEEVYRSMESISTLESDNLTLESLEAELFEDIRASIQKSNRASNLNNSSLKVSSGKKDSQAKVSNSSKKVDLDNGKRPAARIKDQTSSISQPKMISRLKSTSTLTTKRASISTNPAKKDQDIVKQAHVIQKGTQPTKTTTAQGSKITGLIGPRRGVPKPLLNSKSSSLSSSAPIKKEPSRPSSSCGTSGSSSGNDVKPSTTTFSRRKADSKTGSKLAAAGSLPKTPSRIGIKSKAAAPANSRLSSHSVLSNLSSSISPASSISEWSSESSSSVASTTNRKSVSRARIDFAGASKRSLDGGDAFDVSALSIHPTGRNSNHNGTQPGSMASSQSGSLSRPASVQPTGLRMPSPKIGFFDGGKSGARTPNGTTRSQCRLPTGVSKTGATSCSPTNSNGVKYGKLLPPKTSAAVHTNLKPNSPKNTLKPSQEQLITKPKTLNASRNIKRGFITSDVSDQKGEIKIVSAEGNEKELSLNICKNNNDLNKESHLGNETSSKIDTLETTFDVPDYKGEIKIVSAEGNENESSLNLCKINDSKKESHLGNEISTKNDTVETIFDVLDHKGEIKIVTAEGNEKELSLNICKNNNDSNKEFHLGNEISNKIDTVETTSAVSDQKGEIKIVSTESSESESSLNICKNNDSNNESHLGNEISNKVDTVETTFDFSDQKGEIKIVTAEPEGNKMEPSLNIYKNNKDSNKESHLGNETLSKDDTVETTFDVSDHKAEIKIVSAEVNENEPSLNICKKNDSNEESHLGNKTSSKIDISDHEDEIKIVTGEGNENKSSLNICKKNDSNEESHLGNETSSKIDTFDISDHKDEIEIVTGEGNETESSLNICKKNDSNEESHLGNETSSKIDTLDVSVHKDETEIATGEGNENESSMNICKKNDSNEESHLGNETSSKIDTFDVSDHKDEIEIVTSEDNENESSLNISKKNDSNEESHFGNETSRKIGTMEIVKSDSGVRSKEGVKDDKDGLRTPFAEKNCDSNETEVVTAKSVNFPFMESQHKENNSEVI